MALAWTRGVWTTRYWESAASCCRIRTTIATAHRWRDGGGLRKVPREEIYRATGIQFMPINTLYQLFAAQRDTPTIRAAAKHLLTIPDLFHLLAYRKCGL